MRKLEDIGFYTLDDRRAKTASVDTKVHRAEILITDKCNFKCPYCRGSDCGELSLGEMKKIYDILMKRGVKNIRFSGGEPTLNKDLIPMVDYARYFGCERIAISTNGSADLGKYSQLMMYGVNDFSISLDACCSQFGEKMMGGIPGMWDKVVQNIRDLSKHTYVTVGCVFTPETISTMSEVVQFAHELGVADIRVISSAQSNETLSALRSIDWNLLKYYPILRYRVMNTVDGRHVRGLEIGDPVHCPLVLDDVAIARSMHYPCIIYMREKGDPIGKVGPGMWKERERWAKEHDCQSDPICKGNCLDVCIDYNKRFMEFHR